jgi:membrane protease YdiL (CAAX protease family)
MEPTNTPSSYYPTVFQGLGIVLLFIFLSMLTGILISLGYFSGKPLWIDFMEMMGYLLAAGGTLLLVIRIKTRGYGERPAFVHRKVNPANHLVVLILTIMGLLVIDPLTNIIPMPDNVKELFEQMFSKTVPAFFTAVIFAPILEELIFRGIVLEGFLKNYSPVKAILLTNVLFGLAHLNPWQFVGAFLMGILISWVYYKTRNLVLPVLMHFLNNLLSYLFLYLSDVSFTEATLRDFFARPGVYYSLVGGSAILLALFFLFSYRLFPVRRNR